MRPLHALFVVFALSVGLVAAQSPFSGTWKLNLAKSTMATGHPQSEIVHVEADDNGIKLTSDLVDATGHAIKTSFAAKFDRKDYPVTGSPDLDSIAFQRVDANTLRGTAKKDGKIVLENTIAVSKDGQTTTVDYNETDAQGNKIKGSAVYDKQ